MTSIQEYFNQNFSKNERQLFYEGNKIGKELLGDTLAIDGYQVEYLFLSDLPNLTKLTLKNCPKLTSLELFLDKQLEIEILDDVFIKNIKTNNSNFDQKSFLISYEKPKGFCWNCFGHALSLIGLVALATYVTYLINTINKLKKKLASVK